MATNVNDAVPEALVQDRYRNWVGFTQFVKISSVAIVVTLLAMLVFLY